jgi:hypothetical protein
MPDPELSLDDALMMLVRICKNELHYNPTRFLQMFERKGGVATVRDLLASDDISYGLTFLYEHRRLDLSLEALVLTAPWSGRFTERELRTARERLSTLGYSGDSYLAGRAL